MEFPQDRSSLGVEESVQLRDNDFVRREGGFSVRRARQARQGWKSRATRFELCSKMRGGRFFRVGASRLTRTPAFVVARQRQTPNGGPMSRS